MIDPAAIDRLVRNLAPMLPKVTDSARYAYGLNTSCDLAELDDQDLATLARIQAGEA